MNIFIMPQYKSSFQEDDWKTVIYIYLCLREENIGSPTCTCETRTLDHLCLREESLGSPVAETQVT
jgi:hypothetical protein